MPQSLAQIYVHLVFSTKNRWPWLEEDDLRRQAHAKISGCCRTLGSSSIQVGGVEDHVHILCTLGRTISVSKMDKEIKRVSSLWIKEQSPDLRNFYWQSGYGAFSISPSHVPAVDSYIRRQVEHHQKEGFMDEYRRLLAKYGVDYDERYLWD